MNIRDKSRFTASVVSMSLFVLPLIAGCGATPREQEGLSEQPLAVHLADDLVFSSSHPSASCIDLVERMRERADVLDTNLDGPPSARLMHLPAVPIEIEVDGNVVIEDDLFVRFGSSVVLRTKGTLRVARGSTLHVDGDLHIEADTLAAEGIIDVSGGDGAPGVVPPLPPCGDCNDPGGGSPGGGSPGGGSPPPSGAVGATGAAGVSASYSLTSGGLNVTVSGGAGGMGGPGPAGAQGATGFTGQNTSCGNWWLPNDKCGTNGGAGAAGGAGGLGGNGGNGGNGGSITALIKNITLSTTLLAKGGNAGNGGNGGPGGKGGDGGKGGSGNGCEPGKYGGSGGNGGPGGNGGSGGKGGNSGAITVVFCTMLAPVTATIDPGTGGNPGSGGAGGPGGATGASGGGSGGYDSCGRGPNPVPGAAGAPGNPGGPGVGGEPGAQASILQDCSVFGVASESPL